MSQPILNLRVENFAVLMAENKIFAEDEPVLERDTLRWKVGDGIRPYRDLPYFNETGLKGDKGDMGPQGPKGEDGTSVTISGSFEAEGALPVSGEIGQSYLVAGDLYVWTGSAWENVGQIQGPPGEDAVLNATLQSISALGEAANRVVYSTGNFVFAEAPITEFARALIGDSTAEQARARLLLGTASIANVMTSTTDTASGRLVRVGDHGVGLAREISNWDTATTTGPVWSLAAATGAPSASLGNFVGDIYRLNSTNIVQVAYTQSDSSARVFYRQIVAGAPRVWQEHHTTGSLPVTTFTRAVLAGTASVLPSVSYPTRAGLPANGVVPDGTIAAAEGRLYEAKAGATAFPDKTGWVPFGIVSLRHWAVVGDGIADDSAAVSACLNWANTNRVPVADFDGGTYRLASRVRVDATGPLDRLYVNFKGGGITTTTFVVDNATGGLFFDRTNGVFALCVLEDFTVTTTSNRGSCGVGIHIKAANFGIEAPRGLFANKVLVVSGDPIVTGTPGSYSPANASFFTSSWKVEGINRPSLSLCKAIGSFPVDVTDPADRFHNDSPFYRQGIGFDVSDCYSPSLVDCQTLRATTGVRLTNVIRNSEAQTFRDCEFVNCQRGVWTDNGSFSPGWEPGFQFLGGHINYRDYGIFATRKLSVNIANVLFYHENSAQNAGGNAALGVQFPTDIYMPDAHVVSISDNKFDFDSTPNRRAVHIVDNTSGFYEGSRVNVTGNILNGTFGTAIKLDPDTEVNVSANLYAGVITNRLQVATRFYPTGTFEANESPKFTPVASNLTNISFIDPQEMIWSQSGNAVFVSGRISIAPTAANTLCQFDLTVPVPRAAIGEPQAAGIINAPGTASIVGTTGSFFGSGGATLRFEFRPADTTAQLYRYTGSYMVMLMP